MRDLASNIGTTPALSPASTSDNAGLTGEIIDMQDFGSLAFLIAIGAVGSAGATFTVSLQHGDDAALADATPVLGIDLIGSYADASFSQDDENSAKKIGYTGSKRYVRLVVTPAGNAAPAFVSAIAVQGHPRSAPVA